MDTGAVLITGAGTGFGLAAALRLAERGFRVHASVPEAGQVGLLEDEAARRGLSLRIPLLDVTRPDTIREAVDAAAGEAGGLFAVVQSAGIGLRGFFEDLSEEEIARLFEVNFFGVLAVTRAVLPHMRKAGRGRIVILGSAGGRIAALTLSAYCAAKFALEGFGEALALETEPLGVSVSLIEPGLVSTPHFTVNRGCAKGALDPSSPNFDRFVQHERAVDRILEAGRITPADVARAVERALVDRRPRLRYVVGRGAKLVMALWRVLPEETFHRLYARRVNRMVTRAEKVAVGERPAAREAARAAARRGGAESDG